MKGGALLKKIFDPKEEKITEKAFSHGLFFSVFSMLLCMFALVSSTYAWFSVDTASGGNIIESGRFALDISVKDTEGNSLAVVDEGDGKFSCVFGSVGVYTVVLTMSDDSNATKGYCDVIFSDSVKLHSSLVSRDPSLGVDPLTFTVEINTVGSVIVFVPKWGIPAHSVITDGATLSENGDIID